MTDQITINTIAIMVLTAFIGLLAAAFWRHVDSRKKNIDALAAAVVEKDKRLVELEKKYEVLSASFTTVDAVFQAALIKQLTHPHTKEMDDLLVKLIPINTLTWQEERRLFVLLIQRATAPDHDIDQSEREAALILPYVMKRVKNNNADTKTKILISIPEDYFNESN